MKTNTVESQSMKLKFYMGSFYKRGFVTFLFLISILVSTSYSQTKSESFDFPVKHGTDAWKKIQTHIEMVEKCQIPPDQIVTLSTRALIEACVGYPLAFDVFSYDNLKTGFNSCYGQFNGFQELLKRPDVGKIAFDWFMNLSPRDITLKKTLIEKGDFTFGITLTEMILAQENIINQFNKDQCIALLQKVLENLKAKRIHGDNYAAMGEYSLSYLAGNILHKSSAPKDNDEYQFITNMALKDKKIIDRIFLKTSGYIKKNEKNTPFNDNSNSLSWVQV